MEKIIFALLMSLLLPAAAFADSKSTCANFSGSFSGADNWINVSRGTSTVSITQSGCEQVTISYSGGVGILFPATGPTVYPIGYTLPGTQDGQGSFYSTGYFVGNSLFLIRSGTEPNLSDGGADAYGTAMAIMTKGPQGGLRIELYSNAFNGPANPAATAGPTEVFQSN